MNDTRALHPVADSLDGRTTSEAVLFEIRRILMVAGAGLAAHWFNRFP